MKTSNRRRRGFRRSVLSLPYGIFMVIFIVLPLIILGLYAFSKKGDFGELTFEFTFENFKQAFTPINMMVLGRSIIIGLITTVMCLLIGYPVAYFLANKRYNKSSAMVLLFVLPMWVNFLLRTLATKAMFDFFGIDFGIGTVIFGMVYNFLPFMILPIYTSIQKIDGSLLEAANDLGASQGATFAKVVFPLSLPGILSGITMVFTPTITSFVISDMLSNNKISLVGNFINLQVDQLNYNVASSLSFVILLFMLISMLIMNKYDDDTAPQGGLL